MRKSLSLTKAIVHVSSTPEVMFRCFWVRALTLFLLTMQLHLALGVAHCTRSRNSLCFIIGNVVKLSMPQYAYGATYHVIHVRLFWQPLLGREKRKWSGGTKSRKRRGKREKTRSIANKACHSHSHCLQVASS